MKQQRKFPEHIRSPRRTRRSAAKTVSFGDAAALYIEYSKAVTSAETVVKRMRYFAQFYNTAFAERDLAGICPSDIYLWFDGVLVAKRRDGKSGAASRRRDKHTPRKQTTRKTKPKGAAVRSRPR